MVSPTSQAEGLGPIPEELPPISIDEVVPEGLDVDVDTESEARTPLSERHVEPVQEGWGSKLWGKVSQVGGAAKNYLVGSEWTKTKAVASTAVDLTKMGLTAAEWGARKVLPGVDEKTFVAQSCKAEQDAKKEQIYRGFGDTEKEFCKVTGAAADAYVGLYSGTYADKKEGLWSCAKENVSKAGLGFASHHKMIDRLANYELALAQSYSRAKVVVDGVSPSGLTKRLSEGVEDFLKLDKEAREKVKGKGLSEEEEMIAMFKHFEEGYRAKGKELPPGFPKSSELTPENLHKKMLDISDKENKDLDPLINEILDILLPNGHEDIPFMDKIGLLKKLAHEPAYDAVRGNVLMPLFKMLLGAKVVHQFSDKHEVNLGVLKILGRDTTDIELDGFGMGQTEETCMVADDIMQGFLLGKDSASIERTLQDSTLSTMLGLNKRIFTLGDKASGLAQKMSEMSEEEAFPKLRELVQEKKELSKRLKDHGKKVLGKREEELQAKLRKKGLSKEDTREIQEKINSVQGVISRLDEIPTKFRRGDVLQLEREIKSLIGSYKEITSEMTKEAQERMKEKMSLNVREAICSVKAPKAGKSWWISRQIRSLPFIGTAVRCIGRVLTHIWTEIKQACTRSYFSKGQAEEMTQNMDSLLKNPMNRVLLLQVLSDLKEELKASSDKIAEGKKGGVSVAVASAPESFEDSKDLIGKLGERAVHHILPKRQSTVVKVLLPVVNVVRKIWHYIRPWKWMKKAPESYTVDGLVGQGVVSQIGSVFSEEVKDSTGSKKAQKVAMSRVIEPTLKPALPSLEETDAGARITEALRRHGVCHPDLDKVVQVRLRMYVENYIARKFEEQAVQDRVQGVLSRDPVMKQFYWNTKAAKRTRELVTRKLKDEIGEEFRKEAVKALLANPKGAEGMMRKILKQNFDPDRVPSRAPLK